MRILLLFLILAAPAWATNCWQHPTTGEKRWAETTPENDVLRDAGWNRTAERTREECDREPPKPKPPKPKPPQPQPSREHPIQQATPICRMLGDVQSGDVVYLVNPDPRRTIDCLLTFENEPLRSPSLVGVLPPGHKNRYPWDVEDDAWAHARCSGPFWLSLRTAANATLNSEPCR